MSDQHFPGTALPRRFFAPVDPPGGGAPNAGGPEAGSPGGADAAADGAASPGTQSAVDDAGLDVATLKRERDEFRDLLLRKTAEFENYRRRQERERKDFADYAAADLLRDILPVVDDLERALAAAPAGDPVRAGVELVLRQFLDILKKKGVTAIEALGADFDPHFHQAVTQEASTLHRDNEVMEELRRGYKLGDRLLRPAMVKVATRG